MGGFSHHSGKISGPGDVAQASVISMIKRLTSIYLYIGGKEMIALHIGGFSHH
jgi:hypothetical protein